MTKSELTALLAKIDAVQAQLDNYGQALARFDASLKASIDAAKAATAPMPTATPQFKRWTPEKFDRVVAKLKTLNALPARIAYLKACIGIDPGQKEAAYAAAKQ